MAELNKASGKPKQLSTKPKPQQQSKKQGHKQDGVPQPPVQRESHTRTRAPEETDEYLPEINLTSGVRCISAGTSHQGAQKSGHAMQCVVMSTCAAIYSVATNRQIFTTDDIDTILGVGDSIYSNIIKEKYDNQAVLLNPEDDLPTSIKINEHNIDFNVEWVNNGLYPVTTAELIQLKNEIFTNLTFNNNTAYLFTGRSATVSFWQENGKFYLFNSHAIDSTGKYNMFNNDLNKARLFELDNLYELVKLLFVNVQFKKNSKKSNINEEFMLTQIEVKETLIPTQSSNIEWLIDEDITIDLTKSLSILHVNEKSTDRETDTVDLIRSLSESTSKLKISDAKIITNDEKLTSLKPIVLIEKLTREIQTKNNEPTSKKNEIIEKLINEPQTETDEPTSKKKKMGRPIKKKRGPKKTVENAHLKASKKYNEKKKKYTGQPLKNTLKITQKFISTQ